MPDKTSWDDHILLEVKGAYISRESETGTPNTAAMRSR
jgi:hypothetical protein